TTMEPLSTCSRKSLTRFLPLSRLSAPRARRPSETIWSRRLVSCTCSDAGCVPVAFCASLIGFPLEADLLAQFGQFVLIANGVAEQLFELVVALHVAAQIAQAAAEFEQFAKRTHLAGYILGREIIHALEVEIHLQLRVRILGELILHRIRKV